MVEDDLYALAALRYLDRNPVRAGRFEDPATYPWSSCAAYALGTPNPLITFHPSYLGLSPYPKIRQRQYRTFLAPDRSDAFSMAVGRSRRSFLASPANSQTQLMFDQRPEYCFPPANLFEGVAHLLRLGGFQGVVGVVDER